MRIAWFSPMAPSRSGIAAYSAEVVPLLQERGLPIELFAEANAHDFVWMHRRDPYDLTVFQMGNAACHDYMWGYVFRYPGVVVLHDAQLHQARALALTNRWIPRREDYLAEFCANHPDAPPDLGELVAMGGMGGTLFQHWPFIRLVVDTARLTLVHNARVARDLMERFPEARIETIEMGVADPLESIADPGAARDAVLRRHDLPADAVVLAAFGGVTAEKRLPQLLRAMSAIAEAQPRLHLMIVGEPARHYEVMSDARAWRIADRVRVTGYVPDESLGEYLVAADLCACLRWPTNRETSASWLRCLAAGRPTLTTDLTQLADVPTLDPRGWRLLHASADRERPVAISIDLLDEEHSLQLALERLTNDADLRRDLGGAARAWWRAHHQLAPMADAYVRRLREAIDIRPPEVDLPPHLTDEGLRVARTLFDDLGLTDRAGFLTS
jgi:glycosyltransferase involved in cell wall biosynthesis